MDRETVEPAVTEMPGERAREWVAYHDAVAAPSTSVYEFVLDLSGPAVGPFCTDVDGNVLLDFTCHVAAAPLGYNNPKVMDRLREFDLFDPLKIAGQDFYVSGGESDLPGPTDLMHRLTDLTAHYDMDTVFLSNSGAEAVENAVKICYDHSGGHRAVTFEGAFHGRTLGALSLNRSKAVHREGFPELSGVEALPYCSDRDCTPASCECGFFRDGGDTSGLRELLHPVRGHLSPDDLAYVVLEPIQGEGGYRVPSDAFAAEIQSVTAEHDVLVVADEIQSGLGRTGETWGIDHYPIEPDVITCAKGLRVGATVSRSDVFPDRKGRLSSTWGGGDIVSSLVGVLTLEAIEEDDLAANAVVRGRQLLDLLGDADLPAVRDVRGRGLMVGVELESKALRDEALAAAMRRGLLLLPCGHRTLRVLPPLDVTEREISIGADLLVDAVRAAV